MVQLGDLGSVAVIKAQTPRSEYVSTRWYRAPECLLTSGHYGSRMDIWALGCCFYEIFTYQPLFPGENELDQLNKIHEILGSPSQEVLDSFEHVSLHVNFPKKKAIPMYDLVNELSAPGIEVLKKMLIYQPKCRYTAIRLYNHPYFNDLRQKQSPANRLLYSKSDSSEMEKPHISSHSRCLNLSKSSARSDLRKSEPVMKKIEIVKKQFLQTKERSWNMNSCPMKQEILNNLKSSANNHRNAISLNSLHL